MHPHTHLFFEDTPSGGPRRGASQGRHTPGCVIISIALRAAIVAAELPLRGKLRAEATTFFITQRTVEVIYQCLRALFVQGLILS